MEYDYKKIWVKRDDNTLEYKEWFIFDFELKDEVKNKIKDFINDEENRYINDYKEVFNNIKEEDFYNLKTSNKYLPPRVLKLTKEIAHSLNFSIKKSIKSFSFGDDVGGILQDDITSNNQFLERNIINYKYILFNPGVIAKIHYKENDEEYYIYQLDKKNLFNKQRIFYSAFGGHLKYNKGSLSPYLKKYNTICKNRESDETNNDVSFLIPAEHFSKFIRIIHNDILTKSYNLFENPEATIKRELLEELGPINSDDGINLLTEEEVNLLSKKNTNSII